MASLNNYQPVDRHMQKAIAEAEAAKQAGDYAIGAAVVLDDELIACSGNRVKLDTDPTQHAEVSAIRMACQKTGRRHLEGAILYTTAEPCPMCSAAAIWARMEGIVSGTTIEDMANFRQKHGTLDWTWRTVDINARDILKSGNPNLFLVEGFLRDECLRLFHHS